MMRYLSLLFFVFFLVSCQHMEHNVDKPDTRVIALEARATSFWKAWMANELDELYNMFDPLTRNEYHSQVKSLVGNAQVDYLDFKIINMKIEGRAALVEYQLTVKYLHPMIFELMEPQKRIFFDFWLNRDGIWYKVVGHPEFNPYFNDSGDKKGGDEQIKNIPGGVL